MLRIFMSLKNPSTSVGFVLANLGSRGDRVTLRAPKIVVLSYISSISSFLNYFRTTYRGVWDEGISMDYI